MVLEVGDLSHYFCYIRDLGNGELESWKSLSCRNKHEDISTLLWEPKKVTLRRRSGQQKLGNSNVTKFTEASCLLFHTSVFAMNVFWCETLCSVPKL